MIRTFVSICLFLISCDSFAATSYASAVDQVIPGVVNIRSDTKPHSPSRKSDPYQFFLQGEQPKASESYSVGSGIFIDKKGHILTNYHVIAGAKSIDILFEKTRRKVKADVIGVDKKTDLALLKVNTKNRAFKPVDLGNSDRLRVGDIVLAVGNPFGYAHTVTSGIISAKGRVIGTGPFDNFLQTDAPIHPGNSGGPLIDTRGRVIGINTAVQEGAAGIGFAIPINLAKKIVADLMKYGKVIRPWLGIVGQNIQTPTEMGNAVDEGGVYGVIVTNLVAKGPTNDAGIKIGDIILTFDGEKVYDVYQLQRQLSEKSTSDIVRVKIYRRGKGTLQKSIKLEKTPAQHELPESSELF